MQKASNLKGCGRQGFLDTQYLALTDTYDRIGLQVCSFFRVKFVILNSDFAWHAAWLLWPSKRKCGSGRMFFLGSWIGPQSHREQGSHATGIPCGIQRCTKCCGFVGSRLGYNFRFTWLWHFLACFLDLYGLATPPNLQEKVAKSSLAWLFGSLKASSVFKKKAWHAHETNDERAWTSCWMWFVARACDESRQIGRKIRHVRHGISVECWAAALLRTHNCCQGQISVHDLKNRDMSIYKTREEKDRPVVKTRMCGHSESAASYQGGPATVQMGDVATEGMRLMENHHSINMCKMYTICYLFSIW